MTHSPVYFDGEAYVTLVSHVQFVNEISIPDYVDPGWSCLSGLLEYSLFSGEGMLRVYDMDDRELYEVHTVEDWQGLDKGAVQALLDAVDGVGDVTESVEEYRRVLSVYKRTRDPERAVKIDPLEEGLVPGTIMTSPDGFEAAVYEGDGMWTVTQEEDWFTTKEMLQEFGEGWKIVYRPGDNDA